METIFLEGVKGVETPLRYIREKEVQIGKFVKSRNVWMNNGTT
jgi:hypothetical protein